MSTTLSRQATQPDRRLSTAQHLYGPRTDFLLLGGGSLLALLLIRLVLGSGEQAIADSLLFTLTLAHVINHPHFAHSYQIFYGGFRQKLSSADYEAGLRRRYFFIGIVAPLLIAAYLVTTIVFEMPRALGATANVMFFMVGWHYVKQGFGMAMVDAALKKSFYGAAEKRALLMNAYTTWILSWSYINFLIADSKAYFGIEYFVIPVTGPMVLLLALACLGSTAWVATLMAKRLRTGKPIAWNGIIAYGVSLYAWLLVRDPIVLFWIPLFHSLQYLAVVWRFQHNRIRATSLDDRRVGPRMRMLVFLFLGWILGYAGFWLLPGWLTEHMPYDKELFGPSLYFFAFWIFINIHHYLLDTVMWRKGNPDVSRHLFGFLPATAKIT